MARAERNRELKFIQTDLLQSLSSKMKEKVQTKGGEKEEETEEIELTLGLSLNGRFASDPAAAAAGGGGGGKSMISRSSSISNFMLEKQEMKGLSFETPPKEVGLGRTRSLPVETEEERRLRKEQETMRRKEVKRKRMEKNKSVRVVREKESGSGEIVVEPNAITGGGGGMVAAWGFSSQSSVGSQGSGGSGSSGVSDYEIHLIKGTGKEERSPASAQSPTQETVGKAVKAVEAVVEIPPPRVPVADNRVMDAMSSIMSDMPCVSTRGQNGRRVEGFLYKYRNGRDLKIVCVCHGSFLSPAEFVKHAGGGDVENPLKHIVVSPAPFM